MCIPVLAGTCDNVVNLNLKVLGSIGRPLRHTEIKVVDLLTDEVVPHGVKGIVKARGPQVMKGYFKVSYITSHITSLCLKVID